MRPASPAAKGCKPSGSAARQALALITLVCGLALGMPAAWSAAKRMGAELAGNHAWEKALSDRGNSGPGAPVYWIEIPSLDWASLVLLDASEENLSVHPSLVRFQEAREGDRLLVILGHRDTQFRPLERLGPRSFLRCQDREGVWHSWRLTRTEVVSPECASKEITDRRAEGRLVLMTCHPFRYVGPAPNRALFWFEPV